MSLSDGLNCITKKAGAMSLAIHGINLLSTKDEMMQMKNKVQLKNPKLEQSSLKLDKPYKYQFEGGKRFNSLKSNQVSNY